MRLDELRRDLRERRAEAHLEQEDLESESVHPFKELSWAASSPPKTQSPLDSLNLESIKEEVAKLSAAVKPALVEAGAAMVAASSALPSIAKLVRVQQQSTSRALTPEVLAGLREVAKTTALSYTDAQEAFASLRQKVVGMSDSEFADVDNRIVHYLKGGSE